MKEITLKEWSAYLPYGLKVKDEETTEVFEVTGINPDGILIHDSIDGSIIEYSFTKLKPILRDLSDITKEIEHNGEKFVPIDKISIYANNEFYLIEQINTGMVEKIVFDMLISWKFNVFQIPDELIVRVTDDFNPYK